MNPKFICHPDFADVEIIDIFRKEHSPKPKYEHPEHLKNRHVIFRKKFELEKFTKLKTMILQYCEDNCIEIE